VHSLILGWSDKVIAIVNQLCNANESEGGLPIVILSEQEKVGFCIRYGSYARSDATRLTLGLWTQAS